MLIQERLGKITVIYFWQTP